MNYYISKENVLNSIDYFENLQVDPDSSLFLFLLSKRIGISHSFSVTYKSGSLSEEQKTDYLKSLWMLGGLFDSTEKPKSKVLMFPNGFRKLELYQPATEFTKIIGRIKDTIEKKNFNIPIYEDNNSNLTLKHNYQEILEEYYLKGNRISLSHFTAWVLRFTRFEFEHEPNEKEFTRVLEKVIKKLFKINKKDFLWLFDDDISFNRIAPSKTIIKGSEIRDKFEFDTKKQPEVESISTSEEYQQNLLTKEETTQYLALSGDNPSDKEILDTLLYKKQIVLTGVPGVGKSRYTNLLKNSGEFAETEMVQFHANYSYEDFIGSETLTVNDQNATIVSTQKGLFLDFVEKAKQDKNNKYLFVIDELNRGNIAEIFGETILTLDRGYSVKLSRPIKGIKELNIPDNLYIVGTMNTSDRNIAFLDLAIRRRFAFINLLPNYDFLSEKVILEDFDLGNILKIINQRILETLGDSELILGQSYFIPNKTGDDFIWNFEEFKNQFNFVLLPTLVEYSFNDINAINTIVGENLADGIQDIDEFKIAFQAEFQV